MMDAYAPRRSRETLPLPRRLRMSLALGALIEYYEHFIGDAPSLIRMVKVMNKIDSLSALIENMDRREERLRVQKAANERTEMIQRAKAEIEAGKDE